MVLAPLCVTSALWWRGKMALDLGLVFTESQTLTSSLASTTIEGPIGLNRPFLDGLQEWPIREQWKYGVVHPKICRRFHCSQQTNYCSLTYTQMTNIAIYILSTGYSIVSGGGHFPPGYGTAQACRLPKNGFHQSRSEKTADKINANVPPLLSPKLPNQ